MWRRKREKSGEKRRTGSGTGVKRKRMVEEDEEEKGGSERGKRGGEGIKYGLNVLNVLFLKGRWWEIPTISDVGTEEDGKLPPLLEVSR